MGASSYWTTTVRRTDTEAWDKAVKEEKITNLHGWALDTPPERVCGSDVCFSGIQRRTAACHPEAHVVVLNDGSAPELFPDDLDARVECVPDAFLHCGETNAYAWVCHHHAEYDTFVCIHDSAHPAREG